MKYAGEFTLISPSDGSGWLARRFARSRTQGGPHTLYALTDEAKKMTINIRPFDETGHREGLKSGRYQ
jgi:hypothetical protein